jgi:hypothetical protein
MPTVRRSSPPDLTTTRPKPVGGSRLSPGLASGLATRSGRRYMLSMQSLSSRGLMVSSRCRPEAQEGFRHADSEVDENASEEDKARAATEAEAARADAVRRERRPEG